MDPTSLRDRLTPLVVVAAVLILGLLACQTVVFGGQGGDLWVYTAAAGLAAEGTSPYDARQIRAKVAERYPTETDFIEHSGYFLTPQALPVFAPLVPLSWPAAKAVWCGLAIAAAVGAGRMLGRFWTDRPAWFTAAAVAVVALNPTALLSLRFGQTTLPLIWCLVAGAVAHRNGRPRWATALWAVTFIKPHIALAVLPLAWWLGGWRRVAAVIVTVGLLNVAAGVLFFGKPLFVLDYLREVSGGHQSVRYNRVEVNPDITSWNSGLLALGGPAVRLGIVGTLAGYAVVWAAAWARVRWGDRRPTTAWVFAVVGCGAVGAAELLPYELTLLALTLPYLGELWASGWRAARTTAAVVLIAVGFTLCRGYEGSVFATAVQWAVDHGLPAHLARLLLLPNAVGVLVALVTVIGYGPPRAAREPEEIACRRRREPHLSYH